CVCAPLTTVVPVTAIGAGAVNPVGPPLQVGDAAASPVADAAQSFATDAGWPVPDVPSAARSVALPRVSAGAGCSFLLQETKTTKSAETRTSEKRRMCGEAPFLRPMPRKRRAQPAALHSARACNCRVFVLPCSRRC